MTQQRITHSLIRTLTQLITFALLFMQPAHAGNYIAFIHTDVLGNPVAVTDQNGNIVSREHVTPFGDSLGKRSSDDTTPIGSSDHGIGYTGHIRDKDLGLTYMQARYYDPTIGRFMGTDPVGFKTNNPELFNRYAYANNNPYFFIDPDGRQSFPGLMNSFKHAIANALITKINDTTPTKGQASDGLEIASAGAGMLGAVTANPFLLGTSSVLGMTSASLEEDPVEAIAIEMSSNLVGGRLIKIPTDIIIGTLKKEKDKIADIAVESAKQSTSDSISDEMTDIAELSENPNLTQENHNYNIPNKPDNESE